MMRPVIIAMSSAVRVPTLALPMHVHPVTKLKHVLSGLWRGCRHLTTY